MNRFLCTLLTTFCLAEFTILLEAQSSTPPHAAEESPPVAQVSSLRLPEDEAPQPKGLQQEWVYHKSADGSRPSGVEQQYVWLIHHDL